MGVDQTIVCRDCGGAFIFTAAEQQFFLENAYQTPRSCPACQRGEGSDPWGDAQRLSQDWLATIRLPPSVRDALGGIEVPRDLRLPNWAGPTLFTSELRDGRLPILGEDAAFDAADERLEGGLVLGTTRETQSFREDPEPYAAFYLRPGFGDVWLTDLPGPVRFVNTGVKTFIESLRCIWTGWKRMMASRDPEHEFAQLEQDLRKVDPQAFAATRDAAPCWSEWIEGMAGPRKTNPVTSETGKKRAIDPIEDPIELLNKPDPCIHESGVEVSCDDAGVVTTIFLTAGKLGSRLRPRGFTLLGTTREDALKQLGTPTKAGKGWDRFDRDDVGIHLECVNGVVAMVTLMWLPSLPHDS